MISRKRLAVIIVVCVLVVAALAAGVFALIQNRKNQIPEQIPAINPEENDTQGTSDEINDETNDKTETRFDDIKKSDGLKYSLNSDGNGYTVMGIGSCMDKEIVIPEKYKGKPVTAIGDGAFAGVSIENITFSNTINSIGSKVFVGREDLDIFFYGTKKEWIAISKADDWKDQTTVKVWPTEKQEDNWEIPIN